MYCNGMFLFNCECFYTTRPPQSKILRNDGDNMYFMTCQEVEILNLEEAFEVLKKVKNDFMLTQNTC